MKPRQSYQYTVLDVFTKESYRGNPLAVVFTNDDLTLSVYADMAREFGYSETSFIYYSTSERALKVRSFTPVGIEISGAGHNLLGAVCVALLKGWNIFDQQENETFVVMRDQQIPLSIEYDREGLPFVGMKQRPAKQGKTVPVEKIAMALGLDVDAVASDALLPTVVATEVGHLMVCLVSEDTLSNVKPDKNLIIGLAGDYDFEGVYCYTLTPDDDSYLAKARFFNPLIGIDEDPATGTAAGPLAGFLFQNHYIKANTSYQLLQGEKMNHPSVIKIRVEDQNIIVSGTSVITMEGVIYSN